MMLRLFMGTAETPIGMDEFLLKCPCCEGYSPADVMIISKYFYFFWIPVFPFEKDANVICRSCGLKRFDMIFDYTLINNYSDVKRNFRHPWITYILSALFMLFLAIAISFEIF